MSEQVKSAAADPTEGLEKVQVLNRQLMDQIVASSEGEVKSASTAGTNMIRRRIREEGFLRRIIPPQTVTNDDLDRVLQHDKPVIIEDMEPLSPGAKSIPFGDSADTQFYYGNKYAVVFSPITTPEWTKDINELRTYALALHARKAGGFRGVRTAGAKVLRWKQSTLKLNVTHFSLNRRGWLKYTPVWLYMTP